MTLALLAPLALACEPSWQPVFTELSSGLMSVTGRSSTEVYAVGSDDGEGPMVLAYDGDGWARLATGTSGDLWWVFAPPDGPILMGGEGGTILSYDGETFTPMTTPGTGTVFGIWGASADDVWAVGGVLGRAGFAWRWDGTSWTDVPLPGLEDRSVFKVWGTGPDDVWMVGAQGVAYHFDGTAPTLVDPGTTRTLFTVHCAGGEVAAVGGAGTGTLVERGAGEDTFRDVTPELAPQMFGVWLGADGDGWAVGLEGVILRRSQGSWIADEQEVFTPALHAVWVDEAGGAWAVGGQVISPPLADGVLLHRGGDVGGGSYEE